MAECRNTLAASPWFLPTRGYSW